MWWFARKTRASLSPAAVACDMHCHLLPGVDDGVADDEQALQAIGRLAELGYGGAVLTPHIYPGLFDNTERDLGDHFARFQAVSAQRYPAFALQLGAEYYCDESLVQRIQQGQALTFGATEPALLMELARHSPPASLDVALQACRSRSIRPIIAHIERYTYVTGVEGLAQVARWREVGAWTQLNLGSLVGQYGSSLQRASRQLWKAGLVDLLGTDLHKPAAVDHVARAWQWLASRGRGFAVQRQRSLRSAALAPGTTS